MSFVWQNFRIKADQDITTAATVNDKMLQHLQWLIWFVIHHLHLVPQMQKGTAECEGSPNQTVGP